jgi:hypothetical protein
MAVNLNSEAEIVRVGVYIRSIPRGEYRDLRLAVDKAEHNGQVTWLLDLANNVVAAIVPAEFADRALRIVPLA